MFFRNALIMAVAVATLTSSAVAQGRRPQVRSKAPTRAAGKTLCVDVVSLRQGKPAKGLIINSEGDRVLMAVEREVLSRDNPELYRSAAQTERDQTEKAWTQLRDRLRPLVSAGAASADTNSADVPSPAQGSPAMRGLFERELARAERELEALAAHPDEPLSTRFMWLELGSREIQAVKRATPEAQRVTVWAWSERMKDVSTRDLADLQQELTEEKIDAKFQPPDLSHELPPREQSDDQWAARMAIVHYALDTPLDFQGSGSVFVQTGSEAAAVDLAPLVQKMMAGNLEAILADLDPAARKAAAQDNDWFKSITPRAEQLQRGEFRVTRLDPDPSGQAATVETAFVVKLPSKGWQAVWSARNTTQASQVSAEAEKQIADDPQVKTVLGLLSALGAGAEAEVKKAIRFGAATMSAQQAAQSQFFQFRDRYVSRLDGPPLPVPSN